MTATSFLTTSNIFLGRAAVSSSFSRTVDSAAYSAALRAFSKSNAEMCTPHIGVEERWPRFLEISGSRCCYLYHISERQARTTITEELSSVCIKRPLLMKYNLHVQHHFHPSEWHLLPRHTEVLVTGLNPSKRGQPACHLLCDPQL